MKMALLAMTTALAAIAAGCGPSTHGQVHAGRISLEKESAQGVHVMWADVRQDGDDAVVFGTFVWKGAGTWRRIGHIDVRMVDDEGTAVANTCSAPTQIMHSGLSVRRNLRGRFELKGSMTDPAPRCTRSGSSCPARKAGFCMGRYTLG
jgi:hypothetical protein